MLAIANISCASFAVFGFHAISACCFVALKFDSPKFNFAGRRALKLNLQTIISFVFICVRGTNLHDLALPCAK